MRLKLRYFFDSARKLMLSAGLRCPSCGCAKSSLVKRKYIVTALRRCQACRLLFRVPTTNAEESAAFYQRAYQQGFTTRMPTGGELRELTASNFEGTEKDYSRYVCVLDALGLGRGRTLLDYGCSWGYGGWQLQQAGFSVRAYEISRPRCQYARDKLGLDATSDVRELHGPFDVFFSSHVLEHVPSVIEVFGFACRVIKDGGCFVAFTPNGSEPFRKVSPYRWDRSWGLVHPNLLDDKFYSRLFSHTSFLVTSSPYDTRSIQEWAASARERTTQRVGALAGDELVVIAMAPF